MAKQVLRTLRPGDAVVGMRVLSQIGALNLPPKVFTVKQVEPPTADTYRDGCQLQSIELIDENGHGGWETLWTRPEAIGPVFHMEPVWNLYAEIIDGKVTQLKLPSHDGKMPPEPKGDHWHAVRWPANPHWTSEWIIKETIEAGWSTRQPLPA